ncbi:hypothetical protein KFL_000600030 [Klebsormidium nitens]|uniref:Uncharacterized protein n=1 Tax=Klebsormidium nitens TaxID=105231 RepID=A0A1Y1HVZ9_KLENI|nr:hypothetical protein KFL_000600030 [Klebsormidium nitens]|eukprot:GAQ80686.1 hypothetical protein KFL_000600030 [Klebsormidium nitens]
MKRKLFGSRPQDDFGDVFADLSEDELLDHGTSSGKFLDFFTEADVRRLLQASEVFQTIERKRGHADLTLSLDLSDSFVHKLYLHSPKTEEALCELFLRVTKSTDNFKALDDSARSAVAAGASFVKGWAKTHGPLRMLAIEWMLLQDPFKSAAGVKLLPGQKMIGLGCAQEVVTFIRMLAEELGVDGLMNKPLYFHNAFLYSPFYTFINPEIEGAFRILVTDLEDDIRERGPGTVSHAINYGALKHRPSGAVVAWTHEEQVRPLGSKLEDLFSSPAFDSLLKSRTSEAETAQGDAGPSDRGKEAKTERESDSGGPHASQEGHVESDGNSGRHLGDGTETDSGREAELLAAEGMALQNGRGGSEDDLQGRATSTTSREPSLSLFKAVLDEFRAKKREPRHREPVFIIDWDLTVEDRTSVEDRLKGALSFKEVCGLTH